MASKMEIENCFADMRREAEAMHARHIESLTDKAKAFPQIGDQLNSQVAEAKQIWRFAQMGLFIFESFLIDVKRIADAAEAEATRIGVRNPGG